ncbi:MAG: BON domain-containing protein [Nitrospirae bacterium]|nr:BON domain-containing protein [Nitrospirota bacterium]
MNGNRLKHLFVLIVFPILLFVGGCLSIAEKAWEDRTTENQVIDTKITAGILDRWSNKDSGLLLDVGADVWEQRLMLTGILDDPKLRDEVVEIAKQDDRIKVVYNEIIIVTPEEKEKRRKDREEAEKSAAKNGDDETNDFWLETKIKVNLVKTSGITSVNYRWRSVKNVIYVLGQSPNATERDTVLKVIRETEGTKSIKEFIKVKS